MLVECAVSQPSSTFLSSKRNQLTTNEVNEGGLKAVIHSEHLDFPSQRVQFTWLPSTVPSSVPSGGWVASVSGKEVDRALRVEKGAAQQPGSTRPGLAAVGDVRVVVTALSCARTLCTHPTGRRLFEDQMFGKYKSSRLWDGRERGPN